VPEQVMTFGSLEIVFDDDVLEPRPWTLEQSRWATDLLADLPEGPVLELCAGVGQIGLVVGRATGRLIVQVDAHPGACALARRNAGAAGVTVDVREGDMEDAVERGERFWLVLADPPYIAADRVAHHPGDPVRAIDGGVDGLDLARACLRVAADHLEPGGLLLLQLGGDGQVTDVVGEGAALGFSEVERRSYGPDRSLVLLRRP
jgi:methylase of polypeptide subunit release factors